MLPANKIHLLLSASIAFVVVLNSQSALSIDLNQHRRQNIDKEQYSSYDRLNGRQLKGSNEVDSENENDVIDDNRMQSIDASNNIEEDKTTSGRTLRGGGFIRNFQEKVQNAKGQEQEQKAKEQEQQDVPQDRSAGSVVRPSYIFAPQEDGREPTIAPSTSGIVRPGTSFFAGDTPIPAQSSKQNQQSNPVVQSGIYRPRPVSGSSFIYPTVAPSYSPIEYKNIPSGSIPGVNYIPRPTTGASWQNGSTNSGGTQSYVAGKAPTYPPTPYPTTFPPVYVTAVNIPISRPGSIALPEESSNSPTAFPSTGPSKSPTLPPTSRPTRPPTRRPTREPTPKPTKKPSRRPTYFPTYFPTGMPTISPRPSSTFSSHPTITPTAIPTTEPSPNPTNQPSANPTSFVGLLIRPSSFTRSPTNYPTIENVETEVPTVAPTTVPTISTKPTLSAFPTSSPTVSSEPTLITNAPSIPPIFVSMFGDNTAAQQQEEGDNAAAQQQQQEIYRPNYQSYPTWAPTTFLPTTTYGPTDFIDWSVGINANSGRFEPNDTDSKVSNNAQSEKGEDD